METELSNIYSSYVKPKGSISMSGGSFRGTTYERDPYYSNLENSIFSKMSELVKEPEQKKLPDYKSNDIKTLSVEDAIKELIALGQF